MKVRSRHNLAAFTLVELLMVMIVITIIVALVAPSLSQFSAGRRNQDTATQFIALANYARTQSIAEARVYRLSVDTVHKTLALTAAYQGTFQRPSNDFGDPYQWPMDINAEVDMPQHTDGVYVDFRPNGRNDAGRIWLTDRLGGVIEVACETATEQFHILSADEIAAEQ